MKRTALTVRYKPVDRHLSKLLPVTFSEQIVPGSFEYAVNWLVDHELDLSVFDARYRNDDADAMATSVVSGLRRSSRVTPKAGLSALQK